MEIVLDKALGVDLVDAISRGLDAAISGYIRMDQRLYAARKKTPDLAGAVRAEMRERALRRALGGLDAAPRHLPPGDRCAMVQALAAVLERQKAIMEEFRRGLISSLTALREKLLAEMRPSRRPRPKVTSASKVAAATRPSASPVL